MRIALVGPAHPYKGGVTHLNTELAKRLAAAGHTVAIESWSAQYPKRLYPGQLTVDEPEMELFQPTRRRLSWRRPDGWLREGRRIGREADLVVFQCQSTFQYLPYLAMLRGIRRGGARVVLIANNVLPHEARALDRSLTTRLYRSADLIVVHHREQQELAAELTATPIVVSTLPAHLPSRAPDDASDGAAVVHDSLLFFGLVRPYKGLDILLRAMAAANSEPRLVVAGEFWGGEDETRRLIAELGLDGRVQIRSGYVDAKDIPSLFEGCDALVLPYRHATGSQNALMAFEHDRPVIATDTGALAQAITDGVDGIVCAPDDVDSLAAALGRFYAPGEAIRLRGNVKRPDPTADWDAYVAALTGPRP